MNSTLPVPLPQPDKTRCVQCGRSESPTQALRRCAKCRTVPYCSVECQKADWKSHKQVCLRYVLDNSLSYAGTGIGEKARKPKKGEVKRTRGDILNDLRAYAESHNGDTLTVSAWNLLELTKDITRAKTHFLLVTLRRTTSSNHRTLYSLIDAAVLPLSVLEDTYSGRGLFQDGSSVSPKAMLAADEERRKADGALGSVMVMSMELPAGDNRSPRDAMKEMCVHILQPLGLFGVHKKSLARFNSPFVVKDFFIKCLKNGLDGGAYSPVFQPYTPSSS